MSGPWVVAPFAAHQGLRWKLCGFLLKSEQDPVRVHLTPGLCDRRIFSLAPRPPPHQQRCAQRPVPARKAAQVQECGAPSSTCHRQREPSVKVRPRALGSGLAAGPLQLGPGRARPRGVPSHPQRRPAAAVLLQEEGGGPQLPHDAHGAAQRPLLLPPQLGAAARPPHGCARAARAQRPQPPQPPRGPVPMATARPPFPEAPPRRADARPPASEVRPPGTAPAPSGGPVAAAAAVPSTGSAGLRGSALQRVAALGL